MTQPAVHLEGLGFTGSFLAWRLYEAGVPFTWEDLDSRVTAWRASTGSVYPSGEAEDVEPYEWWARACAEPDRLPSPVRGLVAPAPYWYTSKGAPHAGRQAPVVDLGFARLHAQPSYHVNVQAWVAATRKTFAGVRCAVTPRREQARVPAGTQRVVSHGYGPRLDSVVWGWSRKVRLRYDLAVFRRGACFYAREGRYVLAYAYPVPGERCWYAGSSMIHQPTAKELETEAKWHRWLQEFTRLTAGAVMVEPLAPVQQGWRPKPKRGDDAWVRRIGDELHVKPQGANGVRHAPTLARAVLAELGIAT